MILTTSPDSSGTKQRGMLTDSPGFSVPIIFSEIPLHATAVFDCKPSSKSI